MNALSLFSNVGISETYMYKHAIHVKVANELLPNRSAYYSYMHPSCDMINGDITDQNVYDLIIKKALKNNCEFLIATPPCQGFSQAGKMQKTDPRNDLIKYAVNAIKDIRPLHVVIENVPNFLNPKFGYKEYVQSELSKLGYHLNMNVLDTADFGTPQHRKRAIMLASLVAPWQLPPKEKHISVKDAILHLPSLEAGQKSDIPHHNAKAHNERHILAMSHTPSGKSAFENEIHYPKKENGTRIKGYGTTYKRISWDKPAPTITMANGSISSQNNVHPGRPQKNGTYSDARVLTLKEIFILSGLPNNYTPPPFASENMVRQVIGEGIPPKIIDRMLRTLPKNKPL